MVAVLHLHLSQGNIFTGEIFDLSGSRVQNPGVVIILIGWQNNNWLIDWLKIALLITFSSIDQQLNQNLGPVSRKSR